MRSELRNRLNNDGWRVSDQTTHDEEGRETDIELIHAEFGNFHVEVKHREKNEVYWSEKEVEKAREYADRYLMVILTRDGDTSFHEYWLINPLNGLKTAPRTGVWVWRGREDDVHLSEQDDPWTVPAPRAERAAAGFSFKLAVSPDWLKDHSTQFCHVWMHMRSL